MDIKEEIKASVVKMSVAGSFTTSLFSSESNKNVFTTMGVRSHKHFVMGDTWVGATTEKHYHAC